ESHQYSIDASVDSLSVSSSSSQLASTSSSPPSPPSQLPSTSTLQGGKVPCPFKGYDGCGGGVCGRGYAKSVVYRHYTDQHFPTEKDKETCRARIQTNPDCFVAWEKVLLDMQMWLCFKCLHIHAWKKACTSKLHKADVIAGPFNGHDAEFLIHGVLKPRAGGVSDNAVESGSSCDSSGLNDAVVGLSLDMLHTVFQRRITTIAWLQLLLLPTCTLNLFVPNCSSEERSGTRKKLQIVAINQSLNVWREPNGCATLVHNLLGQSKPSAAIRKTSKKTKKVSANIASCKKKISFGQYTAAIRERETPAKTQAIENLVCIFYYYNAISIT
ncbi:hypothetical protein C5167_002140, partial [Papaver somniferum]